MRLPWGHVNRLLGNGAPDMRERSCGQPPVVNGRLSDVATHRCIDDEIGADRSRRSTITRSSDIRENGERRTVLQTLQQPITRRFARQTQCETMSRQ